MAGPSKKKPSRLGDAPAIDDNGGVVGNAVKKPGNGDMVPLNFKVDAEFKRDLKSFAAGHDMTMVDVIKEAFADYKAKKGG